LKRFINRISLIFTFAFVCFSASNVKAGSGAATSGTGDGFLHHYFVTPFSALLKGVAELFHGDYGLSIICVTLIIRILLLPLFVNQYKKQKSFQQKLKAIKPELDAIQSKLKKTKDPEKQRELQQEMFAIYRENELNPLSIGCLPMLIQIPVIFGFYTAIRSSPEIASHGFLWFNLGSSDVILSLLVGVMYIIQFQVSQKLNVQQMETSSAMMQQAKLMGFVFPVMTTVFSLNAPAALPLYWFTSALFMTGQTILIKLLYGTKQNSEAKTV
jgi:YidC/Oxa1 family membrane protein insertase